MLRWGRLVLVLLLLTWVGWVLGLCLGGGHMSESWPLTSLLPSVQAMPTAGPVIPLPFQFQYYPPRSVNLLPILPTRPVDLDRLRIPPRFQFERAFLVCQSGYATGLEVWGHGNRPLFGEYVVLLATRGREERGWAQQELVGLTGDFKAQLILGLERQTQGYQAAIVWHDRAWWTDVGPCVTREDLP